MKRTRLNPRSQKRIGEALWREQIIEEVIARDGYLCHAIGLIPNHQCANPFPDRKELEAHEIIPRSAWPSGWLVADNVILLCQRGHDWVSDNPAKAAELGLHAYSWNRPDGHCGRGPDNDSA